ncbi:MAG: S41 family peptidase [Bacteroidetes bacterium]|nr:S41 family peptidase [Bacteroidota bacterium]
MKKIIAIFTFLTLPIFANNTQKTHLDIINGFDAFGNAVKNITTKYIEDVAVDKLIEKGIEGMLADLDPYAEYFTNSNNEMVIISNGRYFGFGFSYSVIHNKIVVNNVRDNSPAKDEEMKIGDIIVSADTILLDSANVEKTFADITNQEVLLKIHRIGIKDTLNIRIRKDVVDVHSVTYSDILDITINDSIPSPNNIGYIRLEQFTANSYTEFLKAFYDLQKKCMLEGLIIDLRGNGGGVLDDALKICNMFVPRGSTILTTSGRNANREYKAMLNPIDTLLPLVVLIDGGSASASEVVSGCLQDLDRATIIGNTSFGKGLVQEVFPLTQTHFLKLTTSKYYTPSGRCIQKIDHYHNNDTTSIDSAKVFYTKKGKKVYELNGITPDIFSDKDTIHSRLARIMLNNHVLYNFMTYYLNVVAKGQDDIDTIYSNFINYATNYDNARYIKTIALLDSVKKVDTNAITHKIIDNTIDSILLGYKQLLAENSNTQIAIKKFLEYDYKSRTLNYKNYLKFAILEDKTIKVALEAFLKDK